MAAHAFAHATDGRSPHVSSRTRASRAGPRIGDGGVREVFLGLVRAGGGAGRQQIGSGGMLMTAARMPATVPVSGLPAHVWTSRAGAEGLSNPARRTPTRGAGCLRLMTSRHATIKDRRQLAVRDKRLDVPPPHCSYRKSSFLVARGIILTVAPYVQLILGQTLSQSVHSA